MPNGGKAIGGFALPGPPLGLYMIGSCCSIAGIGWRVDTALAAETAWPPPPGFSSAFAALDELAVLLLEDLRLVFLALLRVLLVFRVHLEFEELCLRLDFLFSGIL